jgi:hypothetical protein
VRDWIHFCGERVDALSDLKRKAGPPIGAECWGGDASGVF